MKRALILSGGGARAAYQVGVLKALAEIFPDGARNPFSIICGTSAGAINALTLAAHEGCFQEAVADLETIWSDLRLEEVYRYGWLEMLAGAGRFGMSLFNRGVGVKRPISLLDNSPLRALIRRTVNFNQIDRNIGRGDLDAVGVTAMGYTSGRSVCFFQARPDIESWRRHRRIGRRTLLNADHLMASSAIPTLFPATKIEHEYFGDGALRQLAPISPALHLGAGKIFIVGVSGNRDVRLTRQRKMPVRHSPSIAQVIGHMLNSAFVDSLEGDIERLERINGLLSLIPEQVRDDADLPLRVVENLVISPTEPLDKIAGGKVRHLPASLRFFLRTVGATASGGGATAASYLMFAKPFTDELISLGHKDTMWDLDRIGPFFDLEERSPAAGRTQDG